VSKAHLIAAAIVWILLAAFIALVWIGACDKAREADKWADLFEGEVHGDNDR
jgi:hypothetical protein